MKEDIITTVKKDPSTNTNIVVTEKVELDENGKVDKVLEILNIQPQ